MQPHGIQHVNQRRSGEHQWHHIRRYPAGSEREDYANCADRTERPADKGSERTLHREAVKLALRGKTDDGDQHANEKVSNAHTQERAHRIAAKRYLSAM